MQVSKRKSSLKSDLDSYKDKKKKLSRTDDVGSGEKKVIHHKIVNLEEDEDVKEVDNKSSERRVSYGSHMVEGMEDNVVAETKTVNGNELGLCAILDAHSGCDVNNYLQTNLIHNILSKDEFWTNPESAVKRAYKEMADGGGSKSVVTAMLINKERVVLANVGACRGILCKKLANTVDEVEGKLGDGKLKEDIISSEVDVRVEEIDGESKCVVLANEGIWKMMSNEDVCGCIEEEDDADEAAEEVVKMAQSRGSKGDISCVVLMFN